MYADTITGSMQRAIDETYRRRGIQMEYNEEHHIEPATIVKQIRDLTDRVKAVAEAKAEYGTDDPSVLTKEDVFRLIKDLESQMKQAAKAMEFEKAAMLRDQITELRKTSV